jgi:hypothetical protein
LINDVEERQLTLVAPESAVFKNRPTSLLKTDNRY